MKLELLWSSTRNEKYQSLISTHKANWPDWFLSYFILGWFESKCRNSWNIVMGNNVSIQENEIKNI